MSENTENTQEESNNNGIQTMSIDQVLDFAETGKAITETQKEEIVDNDSEDSKSETEDTTQVNIDTKEEVVNDDSKVDVDTTSENKVETQTSQTTEETKVDSEKEDTKDPYKDFYSEEDKEYFSFKKNNPGTTRADFEESKVDYDKLDRKDLLRKSLREKYGITDSDSDLDEYIEDKLGIPMGESEAEMSVTERVALRKETEDYIKNKKAQQQKWQENIVEEKVETAQKEEMIRLENGQEIPKAKYEKLVEDRNNYIKSNEEALNRVNATAFKLKIDENGSKRDIEYSYTFDKEDKHRMQSLTTDVVDSFNKTYSTENGYNHELLNENKAWEDPKIRGKMLQSIAQSIRAEAIEEVMKEKGNVSIGKQKDLPAQQSKGVKIVPLSELLNT